MKMNKFQQEIEAVMQAQDKQMNRKLYEAYDQSLKEIIAEVKTIMEKNDELKFPDKLQLARLQSLRDQINNQMQAIKQSQKSTIYGFLNSMCQTGFNELFYDFEMSEKFPLSFTMLSEKQLVAIINTPVANIKLSDRLNDGVIRKLKVNLNQALRRGFLKGDSYEKIARDLSNLGRSSYKRALNIARTEGGRVSGITHQMSQNAAKEKGIDVQKTWVSALDNHTRDTHRALDGTTIEVDEYFKSPNGGKALQPHMFGKPSEDCNCRCRSITRIKGYPPELRRDNETGEDTNYKTYNDWLDAKNEQLAENENFGYIDPKDFKKLIKESGIIRPTDYNQIYGGYNGYIGTVNSWKINNALRDNDLESLLGESQKTINVLDKVINQNALNQSLIADRWVQENWLNDIVHKNASKIGELTTENVIAYLNSGKVIYQDSGYSSVSLIPNKNVFLNRPIKLEIHIGSQSNVYVTDNLAESEMILPRGAKYAIIKAVIEKNSNNRDVLRIVMRLLK